MVLEASQRFDVCLGLRNALGVVARDNVLDVRLESVPAQYLLTSLVVEHLLLFRIEAARGR